jgi:3-oxoacyl-[acyl-carrier-protein] synthase II
MAAESILKITGMGILNGLGLSRAEYWRNLLRGACGFAPVVGLETAGRSSRLAAQIRGFDPKACMAPRFYRRLSRLSRLAVASSIEALSDSDLKINDDNRQRIGIVFGTAFGSTDQTDSFFSGLLEQGPDGAEPILFPDTVPNALASHVAIFHRVQGPNSTFCQNHLSGECALAYAASLLERGQADAVFVGGADEISSIYLHAMDALGALRLENLPVCRVNSPQESQPEGLSPGRGFIPGEGATCLLVERMGEDHREARSTYGTLAALSLMGGLSDQGHYERSGASLVRAMNEALHASGLKPGDIDVIGSPANGVEELEAAETAALQKVFGTAWQHVPRVPVRHLTGEFGTAGLLSLSTLLLALREGVLPPHVRGRESAGSADSRFSLAPSRKCELRHAMVIGSTFGGESSCIILSAPGLS